MITALALFIVLAFAVLGFLVMGLGVFLVLTLLLSWLRARRTWRAPGLIMHELIAPMGELQDPQFGDRRNSPDASAFLAHDTAVAVVGLGIKPFTNRAPLSVPPTQRSLRHG